MITGLDEGSSTMGSYEMAPRRIRGFEEDTRGWTSGKLRARAMDTWEEVSGEGK